MSTIAKCGSEYWLTPEGRLTKVVIYSITAGLIATVSFLSGATASRLEFSGIVFAGCAHLVSGTLAVFFCSYLIMKARIFSSRNTIGGEDARTKDKEQKKLLILKEILSDTVFEKDTIETLVRKIGLDTRLWHEAITKETLRATGRRFENPAYIAMVSALLYLCGAFVTLFPFIVFDTALGALSVSIVIMVVFLCMVGLLKTLFTKQKWFISIFELLCCAVAACVMGFLFGKLAGIFFTHT
ncbi:MAG: VIT1/CCC1 transporter family protein [Candidatus Omnitrophota bacterium]